MAVARLARVTLIGAESTGKTTLARNLARHFQTTFTREAVRTLVDSVRRLPHEDEVHWIAETHLKSAADQAKSANSVLFLDTDLVSTCLYQRRYFGHCPSKIEQLAQDNLAHLYLFTQPDFPWEPDGIQRASPQEREKIHQLIELEISRLNLPFVRVSGGSSERMSTCIRAVKKLLETTRKEHPAQVHPTMRNA